MGSCAHSFKDPIRKNTAFYAALVVAGYGVIEALFGYWSGSLTLLSDAGHMGADAIALTLAGFASWIKHKPTTAKHTYGFGRVEVIASWLSSLLLLGIITSIAIEAIHRFNNPTAIDSKPVIIVAIIGLILNIITAWILHSGEKTLNTRAALLHVMGDLLGSIAVLISGTVIYFTNWELIDPILSIFICVLIFISTIALLRESLLVLMEGTPSHINYEKVGAAIKNVIGVNDIHDLHIWTLSSGVTLLTVHVVVSNDIPWSEIIDGVRSILQQEFGIKHSTIQIEP